MGYGIFLCFFPTSYCGVICGAVIYISADGPVYKGRCVMLLRLDRVGYLKMQTAALTAIQSPQAICDGVSCIVLHGTSAVIVTGERVSAIGTVWGIMVIYDPRSIQLDFFRVICNDKHGLHGREIRRYTAFTLSDGFLLR